MTITKYKYIPSANIIRDYGIETNYVVTNNAKSISDKIYSDYIIGIRSFNLVGAYGSGKSSFLLALQKNIQKEKNYFGFNFKETFETIKIVGEHTSIFEGFSTFFNLRKNCSSSEVFTALNKLVLSLKRKNKGLLILIDEFGKFLEFAAKYSLEKDIYFIQQLAEFVNNVNENILLITSQHQGFSSYSYELDKKGIQEWEKVKGRFKEIIFNEPVEQLIFLASEKLKNFKKSLKLRNKLDSIFKIALKSNILTTSKSFANEISVNILPLDIITAYILTLSLQRYGQNERSLFSFIDSYDELAINISSEHFFNLPKVYDYLLQGFYSHLTSKKNHDFIQWSSIKSALDKAERIFSNKDKFISASKIIKTIGLLNIFCSGKAILNKSFLEKYSQYALEVPNAKDIINVLVSNKIIKYFNYKERYIFNEATDLDIELAIDEAGNLIEKISSIGKYINEYFDFKYLSAKEVYYRKGTPRIFEFKLSETPVANLKPSNEIDGFINLIFSEKLDENILRISKECKEAVLFGWYKNTKKIKELLFDIEKVKKARHDNRDDRAAVREFDLILTSQINLLNHNVYDNLYNSNTNIIWYYEGQVQKITDYKSLIKFLSTICEKVYFKTPNYKNELVNKTRLTGSISSAKRNYFNALLEKSEMEDIGFSKDLFPPEKTIYLSLLKHTGIHKGNYFGLPKEESFKILYNISENFLSTTKYSKKNLNEFYELLSEKPFKLKRGFIDFWIPTFLLIRKEDFALYSENKFIPNFNAEVIELINKIPHKFEIKAFDLNEINTSFFNRYREILNKNENNRISKSSLIETIKPFLFLYKDLPQYTKESKRLGKQVQSFRDAIANAKDPEKAFFYNFPLSLGYDYDSLRESHKLINKYVSDILHCLKVLRTTYPELIDRIIFFISDNLFKKAFNFEELKSNIQKRYETLNYKILNSKLRTVFDRLNSKLENKEAWVDTLCSTIMDKSLQHLKDEEESILYNKLELALKDLDNCFEMDTINFEPHLEKIFRYEISIPQTPTTVEVIRYPLSKLSEIHKLERDLLKLLTKDRTINKAALINLLNRE